MKLKDLKDEFLDSQALQSSWRAAIRQNSPYSAKKGKQADLARSRFRDRWKKLLRACARAYRNQKSWKSYYRDICRIQKDLETYISKNDPQYFRKVRFSLVQKSFSLYLKYRWCHGVIQEPPFFPLDLEALKGWKEKYPRTTKITNSWTKITKKDFTQLHHDEKNQPAQWELGFWNEWQRKLRSQ